jgi:hypothetical protein
MLKGSVWELFASPFRFHQGGIVGGGGDDSDPRFVPPFFEKAALVPLLCVINVHPYGVPTPLMHDLHSPVYYSQAHKLSTTLMVPPAP